ncbi:Lipase class 3 [Pyrenophora seminiperda CCB06]|uniref:Lipase class 3 n=1 Tax=Pyrenophora seminiperda CCB06 TaxID=1302712 RepID=A0A3M7MJA9_9PLEO|nr:Lipase class 3 [Pyrenophora seminiperda CCB06]
MKLTVFALAAFATPFANAAPVDLHMLVDRQTRAKELIQPELYPVLQRYTRFASASLATFVYGLGTCQSPPFSSKLVRKVSSNIVIDTQVAVFQNDAAKEFIVSFPGTSSIQDFVTDFNFFFLPFDTAPGCNGCQVHGGVLKGWRSVQVGLTKALAELRAEQPTYSTIIVGHSLGGGLASLAYTDFKANNIPVKAVYTMGALRIGNQQYVDYTDKLSGASDTQLGELIRITHHTDGVPGLPTTSMGFVHTRTEIYELDTALIFGTQDAAVTFRCYGQEAPDCSKGSAIGFINQDHLVYTGISMITPEQCYSTD